MLGCCRALPTCGGCGVAHPRADLSNAGTRQVRTLGLILGKTNGAYSNSGTIDLLGSISIPATTGNPSFIQESGNIPSTSV